MSITSTVLRVTTILEVFSVAICQYPMQFPFPQTPSHMGAPMAPIPPLPPQNFLPQQMPMHFPMHKQMPSIVMPYYSKSAKKHGKKYKKKKRKPKKYEESWELKSSESNSKEYESRRSKNRRQVLTPVVSYVTKDGYVVYQKKIKKDKAKDWLEMTKRKRESQELTDSMEERKYRKSMKHKKDY